MGFIVRENPPPEARDWRTLQRRDYMRQRYVETHEHSAFREDLRKFEHELKLGIQRLRRAYRRTNGRSMDCGCWYPIYRGDLERDWDHDLFVRQKKSTWKRILRNLGWDSHISYERNFRNTLPWDHPRNRTMRVRIAKPNTICTEH